MFVTLTAQTNGTTLYRTALPASRCGSRNPVANQAEGSDCLE
ncbi:Uncharacterized protein APZ42_029402 [Daphnia magna]|uniref:Uncharacterized protein n=1 Tax=Daphnia magna TaxID=35525 RepID=A0A164PJ44_9CRUS|nr:Uncharacterized protein APZ42_029402 [Daphnia magna]